MNKFSNNYNVLAITLIAVSFLLLSETLGFLSGIHKIWPIFVVILGAGFILLFMNKGKVEIPMVGIGVFLLLLGCLFFYLNYTSWYKLATLWPIFIGFVGFSFGVVSFYTSIKVFRYLAWGLISLAIAFLLIFSISTDFWPISLTLLGLSFLIINIQNKNDTK